VRPTRYFVLIFILITSLEIIGDLANISFLHYSFKPLIMLSLMVFTWQHKPLLSMFASLRWLMVGMFFALWGDIFLMIPGIDLFAFGLASFLVMQVCYIVAFVRSVREADRGISTAKWLIHALPFIGYSTFFVYILKPAFDANTALQPLWIPVIMYAICLSSMGLAASVRNTAVHSSSFWWVLAGAILFIASDSILAINKFLASVTLSTLLVMTTYAAAQYLIVVGMLRDHRLSDDFSRRRVHKPLIR
jgi:uncharacterized membrane protein YhhN